MYDGPRPDMPDEKSGGPPLFSVSKKSFRPAEQVLMSQYTPVGDIGVRFPELADKVRRKSYRKLLDYAVNLGVEQAFYQEGEVAKESFIPEFYKE